MAGHGWDLVLVQQQILGVKHLSAQVIMLYEALMHCIVSAVHVQQTITIEEGELPMGP
jgi:hypothetical protein